MKNQTAVQYINTHNLTGIKAGKERETFLDIWMVTIGDRIFARSWGLAEKSWYNSFLKDAVGQIKCGNDVFDIEARIPEDLKEIDERISRAYLEKYNSGDNAFYAQGITRKEHAEKTMEFVVFIK